MMKTLSKKKMKIMSNIGYGIYFITIFLGLWIGVTCMIQALKCPSMTQTELFINLPHSAVLNWQECK